MKSFALLFLFIISCASNNLMVANGANIESEKWNDGIGIFYDSYKYQLNELKLWDKEIVSQKSKTLPPGGTVTVHIIRQTIESANTRNFTVIVMEEGKEVFRKVGKDNFPKASSATANWISYLPVPIPKKLNHSFDVYIVDDIRLKKYHYKITPEE